MSLGPSPAVDGRRARRERSREAIIDAAFALVRDGKVPPTADQVAERAGVSVSSIFRTFDGLEDLQRQAFDRFDTRYAHLLTVDVDDTAPRARRLTAFVRARIELYSQAGPILTLARQRALQHDRIAEGVARSRTRLAAQARRYLAPEIRSLTPTQAANLVAAVDSVTSPEAFSVLGAAHGRTERQITQTWTRMVSAIVNEWTHEPPHEEMP